MADAHASGGGSIVAKVVEAATTAVSGTATTKITEGIIEGLTELAVRDGIPNVIRHVRGRKALKPGDEDELKTALNLYKAGKKSEAFSHISSKLGHWFSDFTLSDEFTIRGDGYRAMRQGLINNNERLAILEVVSSLPEKVRKALRDVHTMNEDADTRTAEFAAWKGMTREQLITEARGTGLLDSQPLDSAGRAAKIANRELDRKIACEKQKLTTQQPSGLLASWKRFLGW